MMEMKHVLEKCQLKLEKSQLSTLIELISLKLLSEKFEKERIEIRNDFLIRGICAKEVDGIIEEPSYYKTKFLPKNVRWNHLMHEKKNLAHHFHLAFSQLNTHYDQITHINLDDFTIATIMNILDFYQFEAKIPSDKELDIHQLKTLMKEKGIDQSEVPVFNTFLNYLR